jgi:peptidoglycan/xylan/chitin deacetylase (PgdA/CDA1 family)
VQAPFYEYSPITDQPPLKLPEGKRLAVWIGLNIEHYVYGRPALSLAQFTAELVPDPLNYGWRDYGPRVGVWRLMELLDRHGFRASAIVNTDVFNHYPQIVQAGRERGWAWVGHGQTNSRWHVGMERDEERRFLEDIIAAFTKATGAPPRGWLGPALTSTEHTIDLLAELGFDYSLDWANDDRPYLMRPSSGRLASIPYSSEVNDIPAFVLHHHTGEQFAQSVIDQFDVLYAEAAEALRVMGVGIHPFLVGQPFLAKHFDRALEYIAGHEDVWLATSDEVAQWYLEAAEAAPA